MNINHDFVFFVLPPGGADRRRGPDPRGATRSQHADQWLREPHLQVFRGQGVDHPIQAPGGVGNLRVFWGNFRE